MYAQHGGILIKEGRTSKEAYTYFIDNSICELITFETKGGLLFKLKLNAGLDSPYSCSRSNNPNDDIREVILKIIL